MPKDLQEFTVDRFATRTPFPPNRPAFHPGAASEETPPLAKQSDAEREYLATCQKLEQLIERKRRSEEEVVDVPSLHQELCLIGTRIQRESDDRSHEEDYLAVLHQVKESLWRKIEAQDLKGEFQKLHFELLSLGHKLGFEQARASPLQPSFGAPQLPLHLSSHPAPQPDEMNLGDVERQIAELQAQIRSIHDQR